jgi:hypothetical protein
MEVGRFDPDQLSHPIDMQVAAMVGVSEGATLDELHRRTFRAGTILWALCQSGLMSAPRITHAR